jgi:flagella basal body P-ring formation protein FlgA
MRPYVLLTAAVMLAALLSYPALADGSAGIRLLPVPALAVAAGHVISPADLAERKFRTTPRSLLGIATRTDEIAGKEARRPLQAGKPIPLSALMKPLAVRRGAKVAASYAEAGLSISTQLLALEDGSIGDHISLRNTATGSIVSAEILANGALAVRGE